MGLVRNKETCSSTFTSFGSSTTSDPMTRDVERGMG